MSNPNALSSVNLGQIFSLEYGKALESSFRSGDGSPVYGSGGVVGSHAVGLVQGPGVIVGRKGSVGSVYWSSENYWPIDTVYYVSPVFGEKFHDRWIYWLLKWLPLKSLDSSTGIPGLNRNDVYRMSVKRPTLAEQQWIAEVLDAVDEAISASSDCIEKRSLIREGVVSDLLSRLKSEKKVPLMRIAEVASGVTLGGSLVGEGSKFPCITVANVQDGHLDLDYVKEILLPASAVARYLLHSGDFLMTEGGDFDKLGRGTVWRGEIEGCLYQNHIFRIRCDQSQLLPEFLSIYSASWYGKNYFRLASKQSTNLASINSTQVKSFPVPLVSLEEQRRIVSIIQAHDERIAVEKARLEKLRKLKTGLMDDLLTGRVRVNQLDELPV